MIIILFIQVNKELGWFFGGEFDSLNLLSGKMLLVHLSDELATSTSPLHTHTFVFVYLSKMPSKPKERKWSCFFVLGHVQLFKMELQALHVAGADIVMRDVCQAKAAEQNCTLEIILGKLPCAQHFITSVMCATGSLPFSDVHTATILYFSLVEVEWKAGPMLDQLQL